VAKRSDNQVHRRIRQAVREHGSPLLVVSRAALKAQLARFRRALPRVQPYYAIKANPHADIIRALAADGAGFDVASAAEMQWVLQAGVKPERLIFANPIKPVEAIRAAARHGVRLMTFDSEYELDKIAEHCPGAAVVVRIKVSNVGSLVELSLKFGVDPSDAMAMLIKARRLGLRPAGVSFHVGSQCLRVENYIEAMETAAIIVRDARLKQLPLELVDIGGGFPIRQFASQEDPFEPMAAVISKELDRLFEPNVRIIAEPGRFLVGPAGTLVLRVIGKAIRENKHWYYLDDGVYGALSGLIFDHAKYEFGVLRNGRTRLCTLAGPTCDGLDIISRGEQLPELEMGDVVYVSYCGAYSTASATNFNGLPSAKTVLAP